VMFFTVNIHITTLFSQNQIEHKNKSYSIDIPTLLLATNQSLITT